MTCAHVIDGARELAAVSAEGKSTTVTRILTFDKPLDCAEIALSMKDPGIPVGDPSQLAVGDPLYVIGSPQGLDQTLTEGILSGRRTVGELEYLQLSAAVSPGSSGSPVFDKYGDVVGMVVGSIEGGQSLNFALSASSLGKRLFGVPLGDLFGATPATAKDPAATTGHPKSMSDLFAIDAHTPVMRDTPDFAVIVDNSGTMRSGGKLDESAVHDWVVAELARSAPSARVVSDDEQAAAYHRDADPVGRLLALDTRCRYLWVSVSTIFDRVSGVTFYNISLDFKRGALTPIGWVPASVWTQAKFGLFGPAFEPEQEVRDAVQRMVRKFADEWIIANKPQ
jgi:hypothetical protein